MNGYKNIASVSLQILEGGFKNEALAILQASLKKEPLPEEPLKEILLERFKRHPVSRNFMQEAQRFLKDDRTLEPFEGKFQSYSSMQNIYYTSEIHRLLQELKASHVWRNVQDLAPDAQPAIHYVTKKTLGSEDVVLIAEIQGRKLAPVRFFLAPLSQIEVEEKVEDTEKDPVVILEERFPGRGWDDNPQLVDSYDTRIVCSDKNPRFESRGMKAFSMEDLGFPGLYGVHTGDPEEWLCVLERDGFCGGDAYIYTLDFNAWNKKHPEKPFVWIEDPHPIDKESVGASSIVFSEMKRIPAEIVKLQEMIPQRKILEECDPEAAYDEYGDPLEFVGSSQILPVYASLVYLSRTKHRGLNPDCDRIQDIIQDAKDGKGRAIQQAAVMLAHHPGLRGFKGWVVPAPRSKAGKSSNMTLAKILVAQGVGVKAVDMVQRVKDIESSRMRRRQKGVEGGTTLEEHLESMGFVGRVAEEGILIVDDIFTTGSTLKAVALTMRKAGYKSPIAAAALGYYQPDARQSDTCPAKHKTFYV